MHICKFQYGFGKKKNFFAFGVRVQKVQRGRWPLRGKLKKGARLTAQVGAA